MKLFSNRIKKSSERVSLKKEVLFNLFKKEYKKKALVSFITYPYKGNSLRPFHTNFKECTTICEILDELGFVVDLVDYDNWDTNKYDQDYDTLVGFGEPIERILNQSLKKPNVILYRNGCDTIFSDEVTLKRIERIYKETGSLLLSSASLSPASWRAQLRFADLVIVLGNNFTVDTFVGQVFCKIAKLNLFYYDVGFINLEKKDFLKSKLNFLWFGSKGAVRKGLDIVLQYFSEHPDLQLYIGGLHSSETDFINTFVEYLGKPNIQNLGFVYVDTIQFKEILTQCGAIVFPSSWEGGAGSVLAPLAAGGLIPIVTKNTGLDFNYHEILLDGFTTKDLDRAINEYLQLSTEVMKRQSQSLMEYIRKEHTYSDYRKQLKEYLAEGLNI
jgi:glycosyltransferase involved in cell wall biosynthesis